VKRHCGLHGDCQQVGSSFPRIGCGSFVSRAGTTGQRISVIIDGDVPASTTG
jgi:hypothetical protein